MEYRSIEIFSFDIGFKVNGVYSFLLQFSFPLKKLVFEKAFFLIKDNMYCYMQKGECKRHRKPNCSCCIRDHPYTTSAHFSTLSDPPTLCQHKWYWTSEKNCQFSDPAHPVPLLTWYRDGPLDLKLNSANSKHWKRG